MPFYRYTVRMNQEAVNQLSLLWANNRTLRNAISRASNDMDRILGIGPPNQGRLQPIPGFPTAREVAISPLLVTFYYPTNGLEVVVIRVELSPRPSYGPP